MPVKLLYSPNNKCYYSGGVYQVIQEVIEENLKQDYGKVIEKNLFKPLPISYISPSTKFI
ncbi:MAG: hypothetical protein AB8U66_06050 [Rickettsiales endosymbiont of Dermacentor nuttalli]